MATKTKKRYPVYYAGYDDSTEQRCGMNGKTIVSAELPDSHKVPEPLGYVEDLEEDDSYYFEKGEKTYFRKVEALQKLLRKEKIAYTWDQENSIFWVTSEQKQINRTTERAVYVSETTKEFYCNDADFTKDLCVTKSIREFHQYLLTQKSLVRYGTK